jgi:hypothetical protein
MYEGISRDEANFEPLSSRRSADHFGSHVDHINTKTRLVEEEPLTIEDAKYVTSYNWLAGSSPIILSQVGF